jgi:hypothetical protein
MCSISIKTETGISFNVAENINIDRYQVGLPRWLLSWVLMFYILADYFIGSIKCVDQ